MKKLLFIFSLLIFILPPTSSHGEEKGETLSPYFLVQSDDASLDPFPLLETKAKVSIAGVIAEIELTQIYKNEGKRAIEAIYVFPLGTKSAIHAMRIMLEGRKDDEAHEILERAPRPEHVVEILIMASKLWREFKNPEKAEKLAHLAEIITKKHRK